MVAWPRTLHWFRIPDSHVPSRCTDPSACTFRQVIELLNLFNVCTMPGESMLPVALLLIFIAGDYWDKLIFPAAIPCYSLELSDSRIPRIAEEPKDHKISGLPAGPLSGPIKCRSFLSELNERGEVLHSLSFEFGFDSLDFPVLFFVGVSPKGLH